MARRDPFTRPIVIALGCALLVGAIAGTYKVIGHIGAKREVTVATPRTAPTPTRIPKKHDAKTEVKPVAAPITISAPVVSKPESPSTRPALMMATTTQPAISVTPVDVKAALGDADAKMKADDLLAARAKLVAAVDSKSLSSSEMDETYKRLSQINETVVFSPRKFISDPWQVAYQVQPGDNLQKIANKFDTTYRFIQRVNNISDPSRMQAGQSLKIIKGPFHATVNKTTFTMDLYLGKPNEPGSIFVKRLRVGLGESDSTPTGLWGIGTKLVDPKYYNSRNTGPRTVEAADPTNPLGNRWLALNGLDGQAVGKTSYGIHGTIDPTSIGQKKSMGCIRLLNEDVELVYDLLITNKSTVTVTE